MKIIERPIYLDHIKSLLNKEMMLILIGQRRVGKSYMLRQLKNWIDENRSDANILYINKELNSFGHIKTSTDLHAAASSAFNADGEKIQSKGSLAILPPSKTIILNMWCRWIWSRERCPLTLASSIFVSATS